MQSADTITIRPLTTADAAAFRELCLEALRTCPTSFTADLATAEAQPPEHWQERAAAASGDGSQVIMLADDGGRLVGTTGVYTDAAPKVAHIGHVWGVYGRESHRGTGVGERLMRAAVDWSRAKGLLVMKLGVTAGNDAARRCYERCGFEIYA